MQPNQPSESQPTAQPQPGGSFSRNISPISDINPVQARPVPATTVAAAQPQSVPMPQGQVIEQSLPPATVGADEDDGLEIEGDNVSWVANEFIHQERGTKWFVGFVVVILAFVGLAIWMQWWSFLVLLVVIAVVIVIYTRRPPHELSYVLNNDGLEVDGKLYEFENFKAFGVIKDGEEYSVMLIPTQRFQPGLMVYFPEEAGEDIVDMLGSRLPMKDLKLDAVDRVVRLLRL